MTFRVMLQPQPPAEDGAEPPEPGEPSEAKTLTEAELVGAIGSKWGPILDGVATCTQQCIATVPRAAPAPTPRRPPVSPAPPALSPAPRPLSPAPPPRRRLLASAFAPQPLPPTTTASPRLATCAHCR